MPTELMRALLDCVETRTHEGFKVRWRVYRVTPRVNPRAFRREILLATTLQLKGLRNGR